MKKLMFALLVAACSSLMANVLIYDYAASFKRVDVTGPIRVAENRATYTLDSPRVANDRFIGYMVIAECEMCGGSATHMQNSADLGYTSPVSSQRVVVPGNFAVVYIKRANSNFAYNGIRYDYRRRVYRAIGRFYAGMFGARSGQNRNGTGMIGSTRFTEAEGFLSYRLAANGGVTVSGTSVTNIKPGFLGIGQSGIASFDWWFARYNGEYDTPTEGDAPLAIDYDTIDHAGFGKVYLQSQAGTSDCFGSTPGTSCWRVKNLGGSMLGGFRYTTVCSAFLFDICTGRQIFNAPISGTFSLKLNNALSFPRAGAPANFAAAEVAVLTKLGATRRVGSSTVVDYTLVYADNAETTEFNSKTGESIATPVDGVQLNTAW